MTESGTLESRVILSFRARARQARRTEPERAWSGPHAARPSSSGRRGPGACSSNAATWRRPSRRSASTPTCRRRPCTGSSPRSSGSSRRCSTPPSPVTTSRSQCRSGRTSPRRSPNPTRRMLLAGFAGVTTAINQRTNDVYRVLASAAGSDPAAAELLHQIRRQRDQGQGRIARVARSGPDPQGRAPGTRRGRPDPRADVPRALSPARRRPGLDPRALPGVARDDPRAATDLRTAEGGAEPLPWAASCAGERLCTPNGIRTRVSTLRGWCPRPLDDRGRRLACGRRADLSSGGGLEPPTTGPEPVVLPITPPPNGRVTRRRAAPAPITSRERRPKPTSRPAPTATVSRTRSRTSELGGRGRHVGVEAQLVGHALEAHVVVRVRHQQRLSRAPARP